MSHDLDIDGISEKLVLLESFALGSRDYCKKRMTGSNQDQGYEELDEYWGWVKTFVSNYSLECAIKFRVLQDTLNGKSDTIEFNVLDTNSCKGLSIGEVKKGTFKLSLRETSNKIIHAKRAIPQWTESRNNKKTFRYWSGSVDLSGKHNTDEWVIQLNVGVWSQAMQRFIKTFSNSEASHNIGQDWY